MATHDNESNLRRFYTDVMIKGNVALIDELAAPNFQEHELFPGFEPNREGVKKWMSALRVGIPDLQVMVQDIITQGDKVVSRATIHGTHKGTLMGIPATGKKFQMELIDIVRFENGKLAEHWGVSDMLGMLTQLGVVTLPGAPPKE